MNISRTVTPAAIAMAAILLVPAAPAMAKDGDVVRRGSCAGGGTWKLKASPEDGRIEVEGEIDSNRNGQTWRWVMRHDGRQVATGLRKTRAPSGSFEVRRVLGNSRGTDTFVFRARRVGTQQVCQGVVRF